MKKIFFIFLLSPLFSQNEIEGRWHLVGYEDAIMYQFVDTEPYADAGLRYSIYVDENGEFDDLDGDNIGGTPHPYSVVGDIITIDTHFGNILNYQMNYRCDGEVVELISEGYVAMILFRENYNYSNDSCEECFDFIDLSFGMCEMYLGVGVLNGECAYMSGCGYEVDGIDYSDMFFNSIEECEQSCNMDECDDGYIQINNLCFYESDIGFIQQMINNSYNSNIELDCNGSPYCGSPNPHMDSSENWGWIVYDQISYEMPGNENGFVEPLELGIQEWENGRLTSLMCGAYIYCQLSGEIPDGISDLSELETLRLEYNYLSGFIPESVCELEVNYSDYLSFDLTGNYLCPPYPECINDSDQMYWYQDTLYCNQIGDINGDLVLNVVDIVDIIQLILDEEYDYYADLNSDGLTNVVDVVQLVNLILN